MHGIPTRHFSLQHTLESGQVFRCEKKEDGSYALAVSEKLLMVRQDGDTLFFSGAGKKFVRNLFALDENYEEILASIDRDAHINRAIMDCLGLRIMRQDPWECLLSFVCSSNSNIPRIRQNLAAITRSFGKKVSREGCSARTFPSPAQIRSRRALKTARLGYREKFVWQLAQTVRPHALEALRTLPHEDAKRALCKLPGVGEKVADCVLLFSLGHRGAFPVDVWIARAMKELYGLDARLPPRHVQAAGAAYFGENAGYAQQFLYHWSRTNKHLFAERHTQAHEGNYAGKALARLCGN